MAKKPARSKFKGSAKARIGKASGAAKGGKAGPAMRGGNRR